MDPEQTEVRRRSISYCMGDTDVPTFYLFVLRSSDPNETDQKSEKAPVNSITRVLS